jgi:hypothetical protein
LELVSAIALAAVAVLENSKTDSGAVAIVNAGPLATVPVRFSVPPLAVIVPVPVAMFGATVPKPVNVAPLPIVRPEESVNVPPAI